MFPSTPPSSNRFTREQAWKVKAARLAFFNDTLFPPRCLHDGTWLDIHLAVQLKIDNQPVDDEIMKGYPFPQLDTMLTLPSAHAGSSSSTERKEFKRLSNPESLLPRSVAAYIAAAPPQLLQLAIPCWFVKLFSQEYPRQVSVTVRQLVVSAADLEKYLKRSGLLQQTFSSNLVELDF